MKQVTLCHTSALSFYRDQRLQSADTINYINSCLLGSIKPTKKIDVLTTNRKEVYKHNLFTRHITENKNVKNLVTKYSNNISVTCPELTILQMASILNYYELALLIHEFCGTFSICRNSVEGFTNNIEPITSVKILRKFIAEFTKDKPSLRGIRNLNNILTYACDNSNSPMESRLYIKLCGPRAKGLYNCKELTLNSPILISKSARNIAGQPFIVPDISCEKRKVAIEYDSAQFHENSEQGQKDKRRRDALVNDGWKVFTFVPAQINNPTTFDIIAKKILKSLNQSYRIRIKNFEEKKLESFKALR